MDRVPVLTRQHRVWLGVLAALLFFDMADLNSFALVAPAIRDHWNLTLGDVGFITSASFLGMFAGSIVGGRIADRMGRKRVIAGAVAIYSAFSLASAFAVGIVDLSIYRVLVGFGLQAMTVVLLTYISEMYPKQFRGRIQALVLACGLLGIPAMAVFARFVVPRDPSGWKWVFVLGAAGIVVAVIALRVLPESVRWTAANRPSADAEALVTRIEEDARRRTGTELPPVEPRPALVSGSPRELLRQPLLKRISVLSTYMIIVTSAGYGFNAWLPTLLVENGFSTAQSLSFTSTIAIAACPGALLATLFIDRIERRTSLLLINVAFGLLLLTFAFATDYTVLLVSGILLILVIYAGNACTYTYLPEVFPTRLRALGAGIGNGAGRVATFASTFVIAWALASLGSETVFLCLGVAAFAAAAVIGLLGERTRNRSLETISETIATARPVPAAGPAMLDAAPGIEKQDG
ncbi:putative MFS transporter [Thermocatellispora tengchongensis]|uniref:Putative MFS transporter n=2 Tax=Thermocatellispora tengchongensis TaxID=1073253 RepID=A0A840PH04_9ACTN|nr:MFS transporter [Thermocatellispora tengchongensis]MBB5138412.1 putative MFS transporter [Thermocatellispora tengchongensis]